MGIEQQREAIEKDIEIWEREYSKTKDLKWKKKVEEAKKKLAKLLSK